MIAKHSPTPWEVHRHFTDGKHDGNLITDAAGLNVAGVWPGIRPIDQCDQNADDIARAVNCHDDLLAALIELASGHSMAGEAVARAAIAKATA